MTAELQTTLFDYAALDTETRIVVQQRTSEIKTLVRRAASDIIEIGQKLIEVRGSLGYGHFDSWIKAEFDWTRQTAYRFIQVAEAFGGCNNLLQVAPSALYLLAAPSTPDEARAEAIARAEQGERITHQVARQIIDDYDDDEPLSDYERGIVEQIEARQYDGLPMVAPPDYDAQRLQQTQVTTFSSESNEWYTPAYLIDAARRALGAIDLDPASSPIANRVVQARAIYTIDDDGLAQEWHGAVFCNPPYGRSEDGHNAGLWTQKAIAEYQAKRMRAGILLVKAALGYNWFETLWNAWPTCFLRERPAFVRPDGTDAGPAKQGAAVVYIGDDVTRFQSAFNALGRVILPDN